MKEMFKELQKTHVKRIKAESLGSAAGSAAGGAAASQQQSRERGFVGRCLLKVELEQEWVESRRDELKVKKM